MRLISATILLLFLSILAPTAHGKVTFSKTQGSCNVTITGVITASELITTRSLLDGQRCQGLVAATLSSPGGDVRAGIALGKYLRSVKAATIVRPDDSCASTCVLVLLGGVQRLAPGKVGLHRPYSSHMAASTVEAKNTYGQINALVSGYLTQMNIPLRLLDEMNSVSPGDIRWISDTEKVSLHVTGKDPVWEDRIATKVAKRLGLSKAEYYRRDKLMRDTCSRLPNDGTQGECAKTVMKTGSVP